jgi:hypothetical protein
LTWACQIFKTFYTDTIENILTGCITTWNGNYLASEHKVLKRIVCTAQYIKRAEVPAM